MDHLFIQTLMHEIAFPEEAMPFLRSALEILADKSTEIDQIGAAYAACNYEYDEIKPRLEALAADTKLPLYTINLLFLLDCAKPLRARFAALGYSDSLYLETLADFRYKLHECHQVYGVWGTFVPGWYSIFFRGDLVKLGRLEYENSIYSQEEPYTRNGLYIRKGDPVKSIHIPSEGTPLTFEARIQSYSEAYRFFQCQAGHPLICICHSWLLHPSVKQLLSPGSNIVSFMEDFDIISTEDEPRFEDSWRIFGKAHTQPPDLLPEQTSMQRAYKQFLLNGGKTGHGFGVLVFDGNKLLSR